MLLRANEQGTQEPPRMLNNFIDFLFIFGHFVRFISSDTSACAEHIPFRPVKILKKTMKTTRKRTKKPQQVSARHLRLRSKQDFLQSQPSVNHCLAALLG